MGLQTPIYPLHVEAGAKLVDFGGWDMPIHYGSQIEEHHKVRSDVGMCDVSHMTVVDLSGDGAYSYLRHLVCNDVARLDAPGKALYTGMLNDEGGVVDDLIIYRQPEGYRLVVNCGTRAKDLAWMNLQAAGFDVGITERPDLAIIAIQGPNSLDRVKSVMSAGAGTLIDSLKPFTHGQVDGWFVARTGYTGEVGVEVILPNEAASDFWRALAAAGVGPVGLGARDTLRLEAGMNLYGSDMDESVTPYESNMAFTVVLDDDRDFVGAAVLREQKAAGVARKLVGLVMKERGVLRGHYKVFAGDTEVGEITSGAFSPTLGYSIALARVAADRDGPLQVEIRNKRFPVEQVRPPFVRNGKQAYKSIG